MDRLCEWHEIVDGKTRSLALHDRPDARSNVGVVRATANRESVGEADHVLREIGGRRQLQVGEFEFRCYVCTNVICLNYIAGDANDRHWLPETRRFIQNNLLPERILIPQISFYKCMIHHAHKRGSGGIAWG